MDGNDEKLIVENVDEQIEYYLSQSQTSLPANASPTMRSIHALQSIYAENRRLEQIWARINSQASALADTSNFTPENLSTIPSEQEAKKALPAEKKPIIFRTSKHSKPSFSWNQRMVRFSLVAAILLLAIFAWPVVSYALYGTPIGYIQSFIHKGPPQSQSPVEVVGMKEYSNQYFTIQYPSNWVITHVSTGGSYQQAVQFRPSATSPVFVNVNVLPNSKLSVDQLLRMDPDVKMGTRLRTSSVTYHDIPWIVGVVDLPGPSNTQAGKLEVAYSRQGTPYRIEFGTTANKFDTYVSVFNTMFASFHARTTPVVRSAATPTVMPSVTPVATPTTPGTTSPPAINTPGLQVYISKYFTIQYPSSWIVTHVSANGTYQQAVQFRPSATSPVFVNVEVMYPNDLSSNLLLLTDPDVQMGTQLRTSSVTHHGIPWVVGTVNLLNSILTQSSEVEVACTNQNVPYKIKLSAPPGMFNAYTQNFNTMLASFNPTN